MTHSAWGIVLASGKSEKLFQQTDTAFINIGNSPAVNFSLAAFEECPDIDGVAVLVPKDRIDTLQGIVNIYSYAKAKKLIPGVQNRAAAISDGVEALGDEVTIVVIHEVSRPNINAAIISETIKAAKKYGNGIAASKTLGNFRLAAKGKKIANSFDNETVWQIQTPQAYKIELLKKGLELSIQNKKSYMDESDLLELVNKPIQLVPFDPYNIKITTAEDLKVATSLLSS